MPEKRPAFINLSPEAKVGLFVLFGITLLVYMSLRLGGIRLGRDEGYLLHVTFDSAAGLDKGSSVRVAGVEVGRVKEILLKDNRARLVLEIRPDVRIGQDFTAVLTTSGLLGEKYLEFIPGSPSAPPLPEGSEITRTDSYVDMDRLITLLSDVSEDLKVASESISKVLGGPEGEKTLRGIVTNIEALSSRVNRLVERNERQFERVLGNLDEFTLLLKNEGPSIAGELKTAARNLNDTLTRTSDNFNSMISENRGNLKEGVDNLLTASLKLQEAMDNISRVTKDVGPGINDAVGSVKSITGKIDRGEGTLGKLVNDPGMHDGLSKTVTGINTYLKRMEDFRTFVGYRAEYILEAEDAKSYFSLRLQPRADKFYLLEVVDDPRGKVKRETKETVSGSTTTSVTEITTSEQYKFSAQMGKRLGGLVLRGGVIESSGGAGIEYHAFRDRFGLSLEVFDFNREGGPHMKAGAALSLNKYFHLNLGYDDFASTDGLESAYAGVGLQFEDEDIKYLMGSAPPVSF
jgi:phospholipid/cholesterol/gamma-HCH transport system substrate-binding protein